jgi:uncharacterized protein YyaL (SSP411 family)
MQRPHFAVTTGLLATLTLFGFVVVSTKKLIPPPPPNALGSENDYFLRQAQYQPIKWQTLGDEALAQARREGRPILLVIGTPYSTTGRAFDKDVLSDPDVANYLGRHYICIRIDGARHPDWLNCFLPISRAESELQVEFQIWTLDSRARPLEFIGRSSFMPSVNIRTFQDAVRKSVQKFESVSTDQDFEFELQSADRERLFGLRLGAIFDEPEIDALKKYLDRSDGLVRFGMRKHPSAGMIRRLIAGNEWNEAERLLSLWLQTTAYDPMDGGWRFSVRTDRSNRPGYDKVTLINAEIAAVLAIVGTHQDSDVLRQAAKDTIDFILKKARFDSGFSPAILGDEQLDGRSARFSLNRRQLSTFTEASRRTLQDELGVTEGSNPFNLPFLESATYITRSSVRSAREEFQSFRLFTNEIVADRYLYVDATVIARLLEACRFLGDDEITAQVVERLGALDDFKRQGVILARAAGAENETASLKDLVALSDAYLAAYLLTGRVEDLSSGKAVLDSAVAKFEGPAAGIYLLGPYLGGQVHVEDVLVPEVADNIGESTSAMLARLMHFYSLAFSDPSRLESASAILSVQASSLPPHPRFAHILASRACIGRKEIFVVGGADAVEEANRLQRAHPNQWVAPALGPLSGSSMVLPNGVFKKTLDPQPSRVEEIEMDK